ncbi:MAG TPA: hypothetical protein VGP82_16915, partial [Ktedonobacterales bacterium]|nr:hypothetical protein [Ktedonobacterales bacterium]
MQPGSTGQPETPDAGAVRRPSGQPQGRPPVPGPAAGQGFQLPDVPTAQRATGAPQAVRSTPGLHTGSAPSGASIPPTGGRSLGIAEALGRGNSGAAASIPPEYAEGNFPPRTPSLTAQMRAVRPPDVARQAMDELRVLAREIADLPGTLESSGLARMHQQTFAETLREYLSLCHDAWMAVAEERLEQVGAEPEYRERAVMIARRVARLQRESLLAVNNTQFPLPRKRPGFWHSRTRALQQGLRAWERCLSAPADPLKMGRGLFVLRGAAGMAQESGLDLGLLRLLSGLTFTFLALTGVGAALLFALTAALGTGALTPTPASNFANLPVGNAWVHPLGGLVLAVVALWMLVRMLLTASRAPLDRLLGSSLAAANHTPVNGSQGSAFGTGVLRVFCLFVSAAGILAMPALLVFAILQQATSLFPSQVPTDAVTATALAGDILVRLCLLPAAAGIGAILVLGLVVLLVTILRFTGELAGHRTWMPPARRYALEPVLTMLAFIGALLFAGLAAATVVAGWQPAALATANLGTFGMTLTP